MPRRPGNLALIVVAAASVAASLVPGAALADTVPFSKIPVLPPQAPAPAAAAAAPASPPPAGSKASPPKPDKIPATEKVEGFFPAILPEAKRKETEKEGYRYIQVFTSDKDAHDYVVDGTYNKALATPSDVHECLSSSSGSSSLSSRLSFYLRTKPYPSEEKANAERRKKGQKVSSTSTDNTLRTVREEKLTVSGDAATLDTIEAKIDLSTLGMRLVSKSSLKLTKVASGPDGMGVFAARDAKGATQFLVTHPQLPAPPSDDVREAFFDNLSDNAERLAVQTSTGTTSSSECGHARFTLTVKPGSGQMATVLGTAFLPPAPELDEAPPTPEEAAPAQPDGDEDDDGPRHQANHVQRARPVAVNVSLSQLASEDEPIVSVTFGWAGKDEKLDF
jgi:hypothetical protein